jgi:hypothetical protein
MKSRHLEIALQDAAEKMYRELTEVNGASSGSGPMTVDRWRRMKLERKMRQANSEFRNAMRSEYDAPRVNIFDAPLVDRVPLTTREVCVLITGGAILAMGIGAFLVFWV